MKTCTFFGQNINGNQDKYITEILRILDIEIGDQKAEILFGSIEGIVPTALFCCYIYKATHPNTKLIFFPISKCTPSCYKNFFDTVLYSSFENETAEYAIKYRNHYIVDHCNICITYFYHTDDTVFDLYLHAKNKGKTVYNLHDCQVH